MGKARQELISIREFAKRVRVSHSVAYRAVKRGRISAEKVGNEIKISWPQAKREFEENRDVSKVRKLDAERLGINNGGRPNNGNFVNNGTPDIWDAKARKEDYLAKIRQLDYLERMGKLVNAKVVEDLAFQKGRELRDALLIIPDRIAAILAKESDPAKCHEIITKEIEAALTKLSE